MENTSSTSAYFDNIMKNVSDVSKKETNLGYLQSANDLDNIFTSTPNSSSFTVCDPQSFENQEDSIEELLQFLDNDDMMISPNEAIKILNLDTNVETTTENTCESFSSQLNPEVSSGYISSIENEIINEILKKRMKPSEGNLDFLNDLPFFPPDFATFGETINGSSGNNSYYQSYPTSSEICDIDDFDHTAKGNAIIEAKLAYDDENMELMLENLLYNDTNEPIALDVNDHFDLANETKTENLLQNQDKKENSSLVDESMNVNNVTHEVMTASDYTVDLQPANECSFIFNPEDIYPFAINYIADLDGNLHLVTELTYTN